jgi:FkbM family methyltransferase
MIKTSGLLKVSIFEKLYIWTYFRYKRFLEGRELIELFDYALNESTDTKFESNLIVLDIGAHIGFFTSYVASCSNNISIIAVEPEGKNTILFEKVHENYINLKKVQLIKKAAWKFNGEIPFHFEKHNTANNAYNSESNYFIPSITIDSLMENCRESLFLIKIDVQGFEFEVLQGAFKTLKNLKPLLIIEIDEFILQSRNKSGFELISFLENIGYIPWDIAKKRFWQVKELDFQNKCIDLLFKHSPDNREKE